MAVSWDRISEHPRLWSATGVVDDATLAALRTLCSDDAAIAALGASLSPGEHGTSAELPIAASPLLQGLAAQIEATLGLHDELQGYIRLRRYGVGQGHPGHLDTYTIDGKRLIASALLCLQAPEAGGETVFLQAADRPLCVTWKPGQLVAWHNTDVHGSPDPCSRHLATPVLEGEKIVLALFLYGAPAALARAHAGRRAPDAERAAFWAPERPSAALRGFGRALVIIDDGVPAETVAFVEAGCDALGIRAMRLDPRGFDFGVQRRLRSGDMVYRPAVSMHAMRVEQHLWHEGVGSFYLDADGPFFSNVNSMATFARAGLSVPRTFWLHGSDRDLMRHYVEQLGGMPVVVKALGYSRGVGTIRADSLASLFSIVDYALAEGTRPMLTAYVPDAVHWRVVVVGDEAVASYRNVLDDDDFRTSGSDDLDDYHAPLPAGAAELAIASCRVLRHAHGGVDILEHPSGRLYLLESNFPCYYAQAQLEAGVDIGGAMVRYLLQRAEAAAPASTEPMPRLSRD